MVVEVVEDVEGANGAGARRCDTTGGGILLEEADNNCASLASFARAIKEGVGGRGRRGFFAAAAACGTMGLFHDVTPVVSLK